MAENHKPAFARRLRNPFLLIVKCRERIQIVAHDPRIGQMGRRGNQVGKEKHCLAPAAQSRAHHVAVVARRPNQFDPGTTSASPSSNDHCPDFSMGTKFSGK